MKFILFLLVILVSCSTTEHPCPAGTLCMQSEVKAHCSSGDTSGWKIPFVIHVYPDRSLLKGCIRQNKFDKEKAFCETRSPFIKSINDGRIVYWYQSHKYLEKYSPYDIVAKPDEVWFCPTEKVKFLLLKD